jgi:cytochrome c peroxidase
MLSRFVGLKNKKTNIVIGFLLIIVLCSFLYPSNDDLKNKALQNIKNKINLIINELEKNVLVLESHSEQPPYSTLKLSYHKNRKLYKQIEYYVEYQFPFDVKYFINGPLVKKSELEYGKKVYEPHGFQVVEEILFSGEPVNQNNLKNEYLFLIQAFKAYLTKIENNPLNDSQLIEAYQFQLIRIMSLSLNGYDATYTKTNIKEVTYSLNELISVLNNIKTNYPFQEYPILIQNQIITKITSAFSYCNKHTDYDAFNRLYFITRYLNPIYKLLSELHQTKIFPYTPVNYAVNLKSISGFDINSFNIYYFSTNTYDTLNLKAQAELGMFLFFDPILSGNNERSCASCHKPELAFTDGLQKSLAYDKQSVLQRNAPSLLNTIFQKNFFYDGRARSIEEQINEVLHNKTEMNSSANEMVEKLNQSDEYKRLFKKAFAGTADSTISYYGILKSIHEYEKTLLSNNSNFDKYLRGDYTKLSESEINGYTVFSGKALCGSCHFFPLFNGLVPPVFNDTEYEVLGVPKSKNSLLIDDDEGRKIVTKVYIHQYAFKTPTVRNIELTAPYMHNGIYKTLEEVVEFYNKGGAQGIGIKLENQTLPFDSLQLSQKEVKDIKAFMLSLTDTLKLTSKPKQLPFINNPKLNDRIVGGAY